MFAGHNKGILDFFGLTMFANIVEGLLCHCFNAVGDQIASGFSHPRQKVVVHRTYIGHAGP